MQNLIFDPKNIIGSAKEALFKHLNPMHTALVVSGGEPTLWKNSLIELLQIAKGLNLKTKVFSNAFNYDVILSLNNLKLVDMYSFDIKAPENIASVIGAQIPDEVYFEHLYTSLFDCLANKINFELRHTMAPGINQDKMRIILSDFEQRGIAIHLQKFVNYQKN